MNIRNDGHELTAGTVSENEQQEQTEQTKRFRRKSFRRQLQEVIDQLGKVSKDAHQKPAKKVDALLRQSEVLLRLQAMDAEEANQTLQDEHAALSAQHAADTQRIAELETQNAELRRASTRVQTITVPDPEHAEIRRENETLHNAVIFLAKQIDRPDAARSEGTAIRAIREVPESADMICAGLGINHDEYRRYLMTYKTERDLLWVIEQAQVTDTPLLRFCRAALRVIHGTNISAPRRRESVPIDPVTAAKYLTGTLKPVDDDF